MRIGKLVLQSDNCAEFEMLCRLNVPQSAPNPNQPPSNVFTDARQGTLLIKLVYTFDKPFHRRQGYPNEPRRIHVVTKESEPSFSASDERFVWMLLNLQLRQPITPAQIAAL